MKKLRFMLAGFISILLLTFGYAQNVGINIANPEFHLDVRGMTNDTGAVINLSSQDQSHFIRLFSGRQGDPNPFLWWHQGDPFRFAVGDEGGSFIERMRIRSEGTVGINNLAPVSPLEVNGPEGTDLPNATPVILGEYTGNNLADVIGIKGYSRPADYYGVGGHFEGGWHGVEGRVNATGSSSYYGVMGEAFGGSGTNYGLYAQATGAGTNWAGYFNVGNVYIQEKLGIGQSTPAYPVDILSDQAVVRMITSTSGFGSVLELRNLQASPAYLGAINFNNGSGTYPGQIGYSGDNAMTFRTSNAERLRINASGYVGIGTATPESWVDIYRNSTASVPQLTLRESDVDYARMNFKVGILPYEWMIKAFPTGTPSGADFLIHYTGSGSSGTRLQIKGTGEVAIPVGADASYTTNGFLMMGMLNGANVLLDNNEILARNNGAAANLSVQRDGGNVLFCELENGRVGIGLGDADFPTDPLYRLAVNGKVICEELKVQIQSLWPDYVFHADYDLTPIDQLEKEIRNTGHLPGIPSAEDVKSSGIEIGEMQRILLEKIEELTLHIIELHKENITLRATVESLRQN